MVLTANGGTRPVKPPPSPAHPKGLNRHHRQRSAHHRLLHSWPSPLPWLLFFILLLSDKVPWPWAAAIFADYATVPKGTNPTLYDAQDFVVQLDEQTFNDTVFCSFAAAGGGGGLAADANANGSAAAAAFPVVAADEVMMRAAAERCTSLVVEFYSDWCGHCRAYAQVYKALAKDLLGWSPVLKLAAINCADPINLMVCRASGITHYPFIKYFPRNSTGLDAATSGQLLRSYQSLAQMRDQFTRAILSEYEENRYADWPDFDWLGEVETYSQLWEGVPAHLHTMAVIFEPNAESLVGAQLLLDLSTYADRLVARRCANAALAQALQIHDLPSFAVFRRGERSPLFIAELRRLLLNEFEQFMHNETSVAMASPAARLLTFARRRAIGGHSSGGGQQQQKQEHFCDANPEICRRAYFVSEQDILKAARIALFNDIHLGGPRIGGRNLSALYNFVDALANYLPFRSLHSLPEGLSPSGEAEHDGGGGGGHIRTQFLNASSRARVVFSHLREFIDSNGGPDAGGASISVDAWRAEFLRAELDQGRPFPTVEGWEHCKGSSPVLRGFTCGLWMLFHALTVNAYRNGQKDERFHPIALLHAIRDWVAAFFACEHCRVHFHRMTTKVARIESQVRRKEDVFLYLWRAHNLVNGRLRGRETEDPHFPKYQFPPRFLCPDCRTAAAGRGEGNGTDDVFEEAKVKPFLLAFYSDVRPIGGAATTGGELALRRAVEQQAADEEEKVPEEEEEEADGKRRARRSRSNRAQQQFEQQM